MLKKSLIKLLLMFGHKRYGGINVDVVCAQCDLNVTKCRNMYHDGTDP